MEWDGVNRRGEERQSDVVYAISKINERFATLEGKVDINITRSCDDIEELKKEKDKVIEKYETESEKKHVELEKKIYQNFMIEMTKILNKLDILVGGNETTQITLNRFETRLGNTETQIKELKDGPKQKIYEIVISVAKKIGWTILFGLGAMLMWALQNGFLEKMKK